MPEETAASIPEVIGVTDEAASALIEESTADLNDFPDLGRTDFPDTEPPEVPPIDL